MINLILTTFNREKYFNLFLNSLKYNLDYKFLLIVIDQNPSDDLSCLNSLKSNLPDSYYKYKRVERMSLSKARNIGLELVNNKSIIAFPDDDCIYPENLLHYVNEYYIHNSGCLVFNSTSNKEIILNTDDKEKLSFKSVLGGIISYTLFFDFRDFNQRFLFNVKLGVGCYFGSSEESDFTVNYINTVNNIIFKFPNIFIFHPDKDTILNRKREISYALGTGGFLKNNFKIFLANAPLSIIKIFLGPIYLIILGSVSFNKTKITKGYLRLIYRLKGFYLWV